MVSQLNLAAAKLFQDQLVSDVNILDKSKVDTGKYQQDAIAYSLNLDVSFANTIQGDNTQVLIEQNINYSITKLLYQGPDKEDKLPQLTTEDILNSEFDREQARKFMEYYDYTPEATATRIVDNALIAYKSVENNPDLTDEEKQNILDQITSGIEQGFSEARDILESLEVLSGFVLENYTQTYDLVQTKLEEYLFGPKKEDEADSPLEEAQSA